MSESKSELITSNLKCVIGDCTSSDGMALYDDKHVFCFSCNKSKLLTDEEFKTMSEETPNVSKKPKRPLTSSDIIGEFKPIIKKKITKETCEFYGVKHTKDSFGQDNGLAYPYYDENKNFIAAKSKRVSPETGKKVCGWQYREGVSSKDTTLFGRNVWESRSSRKYITITEGEDDCLAVSQMFGNKYATVSIKNGSGGAKKDCQDNFEYLNSYDNVIICFDSDEAGKKAAKEVANLFAPKKAKIVELGYEVEKDENGNKVVKTKDASDYLGQRRVKEFTDLWWAAKEHTIDGIVSGESMWERLTASKDVECVEYPFEQMNKLTYGMRLGEVTTLIAPTGVGKSLFCRQIGHHIIKNSSYNVGFMMLEETAEVTTKGLVSIEGRKPYHLPDTEYTQEELRESFDSLFTENKGRVYFYDSFGSKDLDTILNKIQYMRQVLNCRYIFLDHLSIIVSDQRHGDERKALDAISTKLKTYVLQNQVHLMQVSHINRDGEIRGTAGIEQLSDIIIRLERDKKSADVEKRNTTVLTCEKNRFSGFTGPAGYLKYNPDTAVLEEVPPESVGFTVED